MQRFKDILCVVVSDTDNEVVLERAVALAVNNQARLTVVEVLEDISHDLKLVDFIYSSKDIQSNIVSTHQEKLERLVAPLNKNIEIITKVLVGIPFLEIIYEILRNGHDLVIKGTENGGLIDRVFGSDDMHLLRKCPCPVWLVKPDSPKTYQRILAAVDVEDLYPSKELNTRHLLNLNIIEMASSLILSESAELYIAHAWEAIGEGAMKVGFIQRPEEEVNAYVQEIRQKHSNNIFALMDEIANKLGQDTFEYIKPQIHLIKGSPRKEIPIFTKNIKADLVVMGTVARTGIPGFIMGNTAETILDRLECSVLALKPPGFKTPVILED